MLYFIGLGLGDAKDITVKGLEIVKKCKRVYLEHYTSILTCGKDALEQFYGKEIILADRDMVEQGADQILDGALEDDVAFLVVGDPFGATTHSDLVLRAKELNIKHRVIHNASIMNAVGCCGLQLYNFGETVSLPFWTETWKPDSFFDKIVANKERGLHTLCLLDIKVKEQSEENLIKGRKIFEPPRFMTCQQAADQLLQTILKKRMEGNLKHVNDDTLAVCLARVGTDDQKIVTCSIGEAKHVDMGGPLHSLVIPGDMHYLEFDAVKMWAMPCF